MTSFSPDHGVVFQVAYFEDSVVGDYGFFEAVVEGEVGFSKLHYL